MTLEPSTSAGEPPSMTELRTFLDDRGFELVEDEHEPEFFGDRRFRWQRWDLRVQVSLDRGRWFVDVTPAWWTDWFGFGLEIIVDTLDDAPRFTPLLTLRESVDILEDRLDEISQLLQDREGCALVERYRRERAHRWFGA